MTKFFTLLPSMLLTVAVNAQGVTGSDDLFKSNLKIYVVVAVLTTILCLLFAFMFSLERRLKKLENKP